MDDLMDPDLFDTMEKNLRRLETVEALLGNRYGFHDNIRERLADMNRQNLLVEDELVSDWLCYLASYNDWLEINK